MALKYFSDERKLANRAAQIYLVLVGAAYNRQIISYSILGRMLGTQNVGLLASPISYLKQWCSSHDLPPLTLLIIKEKGNQDDDVSILKLNTLREQVFAFGWYQIMPPSIYDLEAAENELLVAKKASE